MQISSLFECWLQIPTIFSNVKNIYRLPKFRKRIMPMLSWCPFIRSKRTRNVAQPSSTRRVPLTIEDHLQKFGDDIIQPAMESGKPTIYVVNG